jgi:hypothetical protein
VYRELIDMQVTGDEVCSMALVDIDADGSNHVCVSMMLVLIMFMSLDRDQMRICVNSNTYAFSLLLAPRTAICAFLTRRTSFLRLRPAMYVELITVLLVAVRETNTQVSQCEGLGLLLLNHLSHHMLASQCFNSSACDAVGWTSFSQTFLCES